jgi:CspA family cold shock protein
VFVLESKIGKIKCFDYEKGYGLISPVSGEEDLFVHFSSIRNLSNSNSLEIGQKVSYLEYKGQQGLQAEYVVII